MAKDDSDEQANTGKPLPHCKALLLCEKVTESQLTGKITLHNLIEGFMLARFPGHSTRFVVFLQLYDGIGRYSLQVEINNLGDGLTIAETRLDDVEFLERLTKIQVMVPFESVRLSQPGRYEVVVLLEGEPLAQQHFDAEVDDGERV